MPNTTINRPLAWNGNRLTGDWLVTLKIDGVRAIWQQELGWVSRANKPLYNIPSPRPKTLAIARFTSEVSRIR